MFVVLSMCYVPLFVSVCAGSSGFLSICLFVICMIFTINLPGTADEIKPICLNLAHLVHLLRPFKKVNINILYSNL